MVRISLGVAGLLALLVTYWFNPTAVGVVLFAASTLALSRYVRMRDDEEEAALQRVDE